MNGITEGVMRILITNNTLDARAGSELVVRDLALKLMELGHSIVCFSPQQGEVAEELKAGGAEVVDMIAPALGPFHLIHGHHRIETTLAALVFPEVPVISFCHGSNAWQESPSLMPNVVQYVAVDQACRERLLNEGVRDERIKVLYNFVDTRRFLPRPALPSKPRKALVFSNSASSATYLPLVEEACARHGIMVDVAGIGAARVSRNPEDLLPQYDLVFAKGRSALEAMAVGCALIQCDHFGMGRLVTSDCFNDLRLLNFGYKSMQTAVTVENLGEQIDRYDPQEAAAVCRRVRTGASLESYMPRLLDLYEEVAGRTPPAFDPWEAGAEFLKEELLHAKSARHLSSLLKEASRKAQEGNEVLSRMAEANDALNAANNDLNTANNDLNAANDALHESNQRLTERNRQLREENQHLRKNKPSAK